MYVNLPHYIALRRRHNSSCSPVLHTLSSHVMTSPLNSCCRLYHHLQAAMASPPTAIAIPPKPVALPPNRSHLLGRIWHYSQMPQDHPQVLWNHPRKLCLTQKDYDITSKCSIIPRCYGISSKCHSIIHRFCGITSKCHGITQFAPALPPKRDHCHSRS